MSKKKPFRLRSLFLILYLLFAMLPIYWMVNMSFQTNSSILSSFALLPRAFTWDNYITIFTDRPWYSGYINRLTYTSEARRVRNDSVSTCRSKWSQCHEKQNPEPQYLQTSKNQ